MKVNPTNPTFEDRLALANRIYDLDAEVYGILGSNLGRVYNGERERTVRELASLMATPSKIHYLRSEIALIGNMARTIPDRKERTRVMSHYNEVLKLVENNSQFFGSNDILDEDIARMNHMNLSGRFGESNHLIICIGRTYGCAGTDIGYVVFAQNFTKALHCLDKDLMKAVLW